MKIFSPYKPVKRNISPLKRFPPAIQKSDNEKYFGSPSKYINTDTNPEMGKLLTESAHTITHCKKEHFE